MVNIQMVPVKKGNVSLTYRYLGNTNVTLWEFITKSLLLLLHVWKTFWSIFYKKHHYKKLLTMLSLCKKEIQLRNLLQKIFNSEHKIYVLVQESISLSESISLVLHPQFGKTPHHVYQAISKLILGQLLFENISLSLYPALPLLSVLSRVHLHIEPKYTWYWTSARGSWDFEVIENLSWQDKFCLNRLRQWTFNVPLTFFAFSRHSDWYPSSMDSFFTYWTVIFGNISFAYSANCFGDLMTTL